uniref:Uncharacterized protein n=1 Tax=Tanacetum cinerariifolium TaxID=118510 RepID=A0A699GEP2_TANCI|nr:hypothetical protein [Tanacetum cinerariifolium]
MDPATTLIPATARHLDAFSRVDLPFSSYKILNFGGLVLGPDNLPDAAWMAQMREAMTAALPGLNQAVDVINAYAAQQGLAARARVVEDGGLPFYALIKDADKQAERLAPIETEALAPWLAGSGAGAGCGFYVHRNGNNLAVLPKALDKAVAVEYVARLLRAQYGEILTLGMGDSRSDARFMAACDYAIIPTVPAAPPAGRAVCQHRRQGSADPVGPPALQRNAVAGNAAVRALHAGVRRRVRRQSGADGARLPGAGRPHCRPARARDRAGVAGARRHAGGRGAQALAGDGVRPPRGSLFGVDRARPRRRRRGAAPHRAQPRAGIDRVRGRLDRQGRDLARTGAVGRRFQRRARHRHRRRLVRAVRPGGIGRVRQRRGRLPDSVEHTQCHRFDGRCRGAGPRGHADAGRARPGSGRGHVACLPGTAAGAVRRGGRQPDQARHRGGHARAAAPQAAPAAGARPGCARGAALAVAGAGKKYTGRDRSIAAVPGRFAGTGQRHQAAQAALGDFLHRGRRGRPRPELRAVQPVGHVGKHGPGRRARPLRAGAQRGSAGARAGHEGRRAPDRVRDPQGHPRQFRCVLPADGAVPRHAARAGRGGAHPGAAHRRQRPAGAAGHPPAAHHDDLSHAARPRHFAPGDHVRAVRLSPDGPRVRTPGPGRAAGRRGAGRFGPWPGGQDGNPSIPAAADRNALPGAAHRRGGGGKDHGPEQSGRAVPAGGVAASGAGTVAGGGVVVSGVGAVPVGAVLAGGATTSGAGGFTSCFLQPVMAAAVRIKAKANLAGGGEADLAGALERLRLHVQRAARVHGVFAFFVDRGDGAFIEDIERVDREGQAFLPLRLGAIVEAETVFRPARLHHQVGAQAPFVSHLVGAKQFERVAAVVRQVAVRAFHQARVVPVLADAGVALADVGLDVAFGVTFAEGQHVRTLQRPFAVPWPFKAQLQRFIGAFRLREAQRGCRNFYLGQTFAIVKIDVGGQVLARVVQEAVVDCFTEGGCLAGVVTVGQRPVGGAGTVTHIVHHAFQLAVGQLAADHPAVTQRLLDAENEFILEHRFDVGIDHRARIAGFAIARYQAVAQLRTQYGRVEGVAGHRATVGVVIAVIGFGASQAHVGVRHHRNVIAARIGEYLGLRIAPHVPGQAQARSPGVLDLDEGRAHGVLVGKRFVTDTDRRQHVLGDLPVVFHVVGGIFRFERAAIFKGTHGNNSHVRASVVDVAVAQLGTGRKRGDRIECAAGVAGAVDHLVALAVQAETQAVIAQFPFGVQAVCLAFVVGVRVGDRTGSVATEVGITDADVAHDRTRGGGNLRFAVITAQAVHGGHGQVVGQPGRVLGDVVFTARGVFVVAGEIAPALGVLVGRQPRVDLFLRLVAERRHFQRIAVVDVPVGLDQVFRRLRRGDVLAGFVVALALDVGALHQAEDEQLVLDDRTAEPHIALQVVGAARAFPGDEFIAILVLSVGIDIRTLQRFRLVNDVGAAFPLIGAALGGHGQYAAQRAPVFGAVTACLDFLRADGVERHLIEGHAVERVGDIEAIDVIHVFRRRCTAQRRHVTAAQRGLANAAIATGGARRQQSHRGDIARDRQAVDCGLAQNGTRFRRREVDTRCARTGDGHGRDVAEVGGGTLARVDNHRLVRVAPIAGLAATMTVPAAALPETLPVVACAYATLTTAVDATVARNASDSVCDALGDAPVGGGDGRRVRPDAGRPSDIATTAIAAGNRGRLPAQSASATLHAGVPVGPVPDAVGTEVGDGAAVLGPDQGAFDGPLIEPVTGRFGRMPVGGGRGAELRRRQRLFVDHVACGGIAAINAEVGVELPVCAALRCANDVMPFACTGIRFAIRFSMQFGMHFSIRVSHITSLKLHGKFSHALVLPGRASRPWGAGMRWCSMSGGVADGRISPAWHAGTSRIIMQIKINGELRAYIEPLTEAEYSALERSVLAEGCRDALVLWQDTLVDGHNRYQICQEHGIPFKAVENTSFRDLDDVKLWMIDNNLGRRSISDYQRGVLALRKKEIVRARALELAAEAAAEDAAIAPPDGEAKPKPAAMPLTSREDIARAARLSSATISQIEKIQKTATPELVEAVRSGTISINAAATVASLPEDAQIAAVAGGKKELQKAAKEVRELRTAGRPAREPKEAKGGREDGGYHRHPTEADDLRAENAALREKNAALLEEITTLQRRISELVAS